jgi:hypothetical protein
LCRHEGAVTGLRLAPLGPDKRPLGVNPELLPAQLVLLAIGQGTLGHLVEGLDGVQTARGRVVADAAGRTGNPRVLRRRGLQERRQRGGQRGRRGPRRRRRHRRAAAPRRRGGGLMPDISANTAGIRSPNPFWLASAPPTNSGDQIMRAFDAGWGGAVWKTLGQPHQNVSSRFGGHRLGGRDGVGFNNIELITDRPLESNFREIAEVKKRYPKHAVIASLMVETREEWKEIIKRSEDAGATASSSTSAARTACASAAWARRSARSRRSTSASPRGPRSSHASPCWSSSPPTSATSCRTASPPRPAAPTASRSSTPSRASSASTSTDGAPAARGRRSTNGGYCGPAVKPIALHMAAALARDPPKFGLPISGIGGISNWRDAVEFLAARLVAACRCAPRSCCAATASSRT